ncbi:Anti-sigma regulatory factor (Ser/Thr protein kinase) [Marinactinospora thermotolerans DSM 45154]|uniref:Anti-sigma regulatory factor (Ser/Thr protein kinase) n=1 Tax=Marinactinospora thermotolerans DSM 45154 TaxID=1122192 RepID=A0A1T4TE62_9ACTN|nr:ATP-binding protein [Marinactinospora thermotolerans]SKA38479.1 Anti-sigma regulatory factor (Ser/Thr protein kinase) [Marinactinospora thermotolerans DSM 45154]
MSVCFSAFPGRPEGVALARRFVGGALRIAPEADVSAEMVERAELITSELCANAVLHTLSGGPDGTFRVRVQVDARGARTEVRTLPPRRPCDLPRVLEPDPGSERGRGMFLVDRLAARWGTLAPAEDGVYFVLRWLSPPAPPPRPAPLPRRSAVERRGR